MLLFVPLLALGLSLTLLANQYRSIVYRTTEVFETKTRHRVRNRPGLAECAHAPMICLGNLVREKKILDKRPRELKALRSRLVWWCIAVTIWYMVPLVTTFLSFFVYTAVQGRRLKRSVAFTALSLFNALKAPLDQLVGMVARVREFLESIRRAEAFLQETRLGTTPVGSP